MAEENIPAPVRSDEQLVPVNERIPYGHTNSLLDVEKQKNPIFKLTVDILKDTSFFNAFTASASVPSIYVQQFWHSLVCDIDGEYQFQLDEAWFKLNANLLRKALEITPRNHENPFMPPPHGDVLVDFVNNLGYPSEVQHISRMFINDLYQPWRTFITLLNQCLTGKTSGTDRTRAPCLQMMWGVIT